MYPVNALCPWLVDALHKLEAAAAAGRLGHGWLIAGPSGVGKRNLAYCFAGRLLHRQASTEAPPIATPTDIVSAYDALSESVDLPPDLHRITPEDDKRSISVQQVRTMTAALGLTPHAAGSKIVIIEAAESMTIGAANALLKALEEPTPNTYLLLLAEQPGRLPATIRSRCQQLHLKPPRVEDTLAWIGKSNQRVTELPMRLLSRSPIAAARAMGDPDYFSNYSSIYSDIHALYAGEADPHVLAEKWHKGGTDLALSCLIDSLQGVLRGRLVPDRSNRITVSGDEFIENTRNGLATDLLFEGLESAESLRDQIGRGINVELALRALLAGLDPATNNRVR